MFLEQNINRENNFGKYLLGSLLVFIAAQVGVLPLLIAVIIKVIQEKKDLKTAMNNMYNILDSNLFLFLMLLSFVIGLLVLFVVIRKVHNQTILSVTTSRKKFDWGRFWFSFSIWAVFTIISTAISYYSSPEMFVINFKPMPFLILFVIAVLLIPIQTSLEEYLFRGYLMQGFAVGTLNKKFMIGCFYTLFFIPIYIVVKSLIMYFFSSQELFLIQIEVVFLSISSLFFIDSVLKKIYFFESKIYTKIYQLGKNKFNPLFITSVIFGSLHLMNPEIDKLGYVILVYYIGTGFLLGILTLMDEGMELSLGFHAANNLIGCLLVTTDWTVLQTNSILKDISEPKAGLEIFVPVLVIYPLIIFVFSKKYGWTNWKEKLFGEI